MSILMHIEMKNKALVYEKFFKLQIMEKIFELLGEKKITQTQLAKKMKLSKSQVSRLLSDDRNLTLSSIAKIFYALGEEIAFLTKSELERFKEQKSLSKKSVNMVLPLKKVPYISLKGKSTRLGRHHKRK